MLHATHMYAAQVGIRLCNKCEQNPRLHLYVHIPSIKKIPTSELSYALNKNMRHAYLYERTYVHVHRRTNMNLQATHKMLKNIIMSSTLYSLYNKLRKLYVMNNIKISLC